MAKKDIAFIVSLFSVCFFLSLPVYSQETLPVEVTIYDFHSDGSCPDFNPGLLGQNYTGGLNEGMVDSSLDENGLPQRGTSVNLSYHINKWYQEWPQGDDYSVPVYNRPSGTLNSITNASYDTAYKNIKFVDTLYFQQDVGDIYTYSSGSFWPVDGRGFGAEQSLNWNGDMISAHNYSFTMHIHRDVMFKMGQEFTFTGDDDVWVFIDSTLVLDIGGIHLPETKSFTLNEELAARLGLEEGETFAFDFFYAERQAEASNIHITSNIITSIATVLTLTVEDTTINAGDSVDITGQIFDQNDSLRADLQELIGWRIINPQEGDYLTRDSGATSTFTGTQAFRTAQVEASFTDPQDPTNILRDTANITIEPASAAQVVIERYSGSALAQADFTSDVDATTTANPLDLIVFDEYDTEGYAYAVTRDIYGNYTGLASSAEWSSLNTGIAGISGTSSKLWEGYLQRVTSGNTQIVARQGSLTPDTVNLNIYDATLTDIRLVDSDGNPITDITINTDQEKRVIVEGIWSDNPGVWVPVSGSWDITDSLRSTNPIPTGTAGSWNYSPVNPGTGTLTVTSGDQNISVPVTVSPADPNRIELDILTPESQRIAGQPIDIELTIYNTDGVHPGVNSSFPDIFEDLLIYDDSTVADTPWLVVDTDTIGFLTTKDESFNRGKDTIQVVLYYAPYFWDDSLHQIKATLTTGSSEVPSGQISGTTDPFRLLPGTIDSLCLENSTGDAMPDDTVLYYPSDGLTLVAVGYDVYGNLIGNERSLWTKSGTLHEIGKDSTYQIYYATQGVSNDEQGNIKAQSLFNLDIYDEITIRIKGPDSKLDSAVTRDRNADGYLDAVELFFDKNVHIPENYDLQNSIILEYDYSSSNLIDFSIDSIVPIGSQDSSTRFMVYFSQDSSVNSGQTGWTPYITISDIEGAFDVTEQETKDGAGPVIWSVVKEIKDADDRARDLVTVTFSEDIVDIKGNTLNSSYYDPWQLFDVWTYDANGNFYQEEHILDSIYTTEDSKDRIKFRMENGEVLSANHYFSIDSSANLITDENIVAPDNDNIKTRVVVKGQTGDLVIGPNPFKPSVELKDTLEDEFGNLRAFTVPDAKYLEETYGGTILQMKLNIPSKVNLKNGEAEIYAKVLVFDGIGNLTYSSENDENIIPTEESEIDGYWNDFYNDHAAGYDVKLAMMWHGITDDGRKAAPGIYRIIIFLNVEYSEGTGFESFVQKYVANVGIRR